MKSSNNDPKSVRSSGGQDRYDPEKGSEEDRFSKLVRMGRHTSHQLNNLLTSILANTQLISLMTKDEDPKPLLKAIEEATLNAGAMVLEFQKYMRSLVENKLGEADELPKDE